ncbi:MAG: Slp family lipoprotein [Syntrophorhabdaceae bacterium]|nr:Slp family lipoprotein [Syntrophorhabdaceae bacterium]MDD4195316.1 Slp family lipoprotein [Syntrophorhabdaceae bacterium]
MKRIAMTILLVFSIASCTSAIRPDLMEQGNRNPSLAALIQSPEMYRDQLFILGGIVARTTLKAEGSEIEALYVPVDGWGYPQDITSSNQRFLALYPREKGILDPLVYHKNRGISIAGVFTGVVTGRVDEMEYVFPMFRIMQIYLEPKRPPPTVYYYYPSPYIGPGWWGYSWGPW